MTYEAHLQSRPTHAVELSEVGKRPCFDIGVEQTKSFWQVGGMQAVSKTRAGVLSN